MTDKKKLRKDFSGTRKTAKSSRKDTCISQRLLDQEEIRNADTILLFASFGSEPDTWTIAGKLLDSGKTLGFPRCAENGEMTFHKISELSQLVENPRSYGIREPSGTLPCPEITSDTVCIVPGLAFTENGARLGYGGGFYDRFLKDHNVHTIALAYEACITDSLPEEQHDLRVGKIVTEERTVLCN